LRPAAGSKRLAARSLELAVSPFAQTKLSSLHYERSKVGLKFGQGKSGRGQPAHFCWASKVGGGGGRKKRWPLKDKIVRDSSLGASNVICLRKIVYP